MIQANELRIGNKVIYSNSNTMYTVIGIHEYGIDVEDEMETTYMEYDCFEPIELTEEILLKCGFEKFEDHNKYGWYLKVDNRYLCWCFNEYISLEFTEKQAYLNYNDTLFDYPCKYLHQLQNLYFALTSKEL